MLGSFKNLINNYPKITQIDTVLTTECNLQCTYCYINQTKGMMSVDTYLTMLDNLTDVLDTKLKITLFGGEPLLNLDCVYATPQLKTKYPQIESVTLITNGTLLTEDILNFLQQNNMGLSVSWDGEYTTQQCTRPTHTQDTVYKYNFENIADLLLKYNHAGIKAMVSPTNVMNLVQNAEYFKNLGFKHLDFTIVRDNIWSEEDIILFKIHLNFLYMLYKNEKWAEYGIRIGLFDIPIHDYLAKQKGNTREYSCFAGSTGIAVMPTGDIYPCTRFGTNNKYKLGNTQTGLHTNIDELHARHVMVNSKIADYISVCNNCSIGAFCYLGCLYSQLINNHTTLAPITSICALHKVMSKFAFKLYVEDAAFKKFFDNIYGV